MKVPLGHGAAGQQAGLQHGGREQAEQAARDRAGDLRVAQYTVVVERGGRDALAAALKHEGIPIAVYYPTPLHLQSAYRHYPVAGGELPVAEQLSRC